MVPCRSIIRAGFNDSSRTASRSRSKLSIVALRLEGTNSKAEAYGLTSCPWPDRAMAILTSGLARAPSSMAFAI